MTERAPYTDAQRAEWERRARAVCACGHPRHRHAAGPPGVDACDEDGCECGDFREAGVPAGAAG